MTTVLNINVLIRELSCAFFSTVYPLDEMTHEEREEIAEGFINFLEAQNLMLIKASPSVQTPAPDVGDMMQSISRAISKFADCSGGQHDYYELSLAFGGALGKIHSALVEREELRKQCQGQTALLTKMGERVRALEDENHALKIDNAMLKSNSVITLEGGKVGT